MFPLLAQTAPADSMLGYIVVGIVVVGLSSIVQLALAGKQLFGGNKGERQIEPTQLASIAAEMAEQTSTLNKLDREMGEAKAGIKAVDDKISAQGKNIDDAFRRINAISQESAGVKARLEDHLADHRAGKV